MKRTSVSCIQYGKHASRTLDTCSHAPAMMDSIFVNLPLQQTALNRNPLTCLEWWNPTADPIIHHEEGMTLSFSDQIRFDRLLTRHPLWPKMFRSCNKKSMHTGPRHKRHTYYIFDASKNDDWPAIQQQFVVPLVKTRHHYLDPHIRSPANKKTPTRVQMQKKNTCILMHFEIMVYKFMSACWNISLSIYTFK